MPAVSAAQRRFSFTKRGKEALGEDAPKYQHTRGKLPERVKDGKPIRSHTRGKKSKG